MAISRVVDIDIEMDAVVVITEHSQLLDCLPHDSRLKSVISGGSSSISHRMAFPNDLIALVLALKFDGILGCRGMDLQATVCQEMDGHLGN